MLSKIAAEKKKRVAEAKRSVPLEAIKEKISLREPLRPFLESLLKPGVSVIAEVKKASPSKGDLGLKVSVAELAKQYLAGGARAISVLTEGDFFMGSATDLVSVRQAVELPVLRKDFVIDSYQLYESRAMNADAVLLIAGFLSEKTLAGYLETCGELGLAALVETHSADEVGMALRVGAKILGINNRDLRTFETDIARTITLAGLVPENVVLVSESGIHSAEDVARLSAAGADAVLVGESLVKADDPAEKIREFTKEGN